VGYVWEGLEAIGGAGAWVGLGTVRNEGADCRGQKGWDQVKSERVGAGSLGPRRGGRGPAGPLHGTQDGVRPAAIRVAGALAGAAPAAAGWAEWPGAGRGGGGGSADRAVQQRRWEGVR
jgi:hypothetical protein